MKSPQRTLSIRVQLLASFGLLLVTGLTVLVLDEINLRADINTFNMVRNESLTGLRRVKSISDAYGLDIVDTTFRVRNNLMGWDQGVEVVNAAEGVVDRDWRALLTSDSPAEQTALMNDLAKTRVSADRAANKLLAILKAKDLAALGKFADTELYPAIDPVTDRLKFLSDLKMLDADRLVSEQVVHARQLGWWRVVLSVASLLAVLIVGRSIVRNIYKGVENLVYLAKHARDRDYVVPEKSLPDGEVGQIHAALLTMRHDLLAYESELVESEARAQNANRAKSSFLAAMSHEIRTPMVGVTGMLELLAHTRLDREQRQQLDIAQHSAHSLLQIIGDILDFSKIEAGKLELNPAPTDLRQLVRTSTHNFLATASAKGLRLECRIDESIGAAHLADALRLRQILSNFLSNALKFTERGEVRVDLERLAAEDQRELIALRVRDTGIGISADDQTQLFRPFAQAEDDNARQRGGTGLGLSICRHLANLMRGEVVLESQLGTGTQLSLIVWLPLADSALLRNITFPTVASLTSARPALSVADAELAGRLILLADDNSTNRAVISRQLNQLGYTCETANDGDAAWQLWRSGRYSLLLTDLHMPRRDGYWLLKTIRDAESQSHSVRAPLITLSANVSTNEVERSRAAGSDDFLAKPTPLALLASTLHRYLPLPADTGRIAEHDTVIDALSPMVIDALSPLAQIAAGDPGLLKELLTDFADSARQDLAALHTALAIGDLDAVAHEAHRIKGASSMAGAAAMTACAEHIETAALDRTLSHPHNGSAVELAEHLERFVAANHIDSRTT